MRLEKDVRLRKAGTSFLMCCNAPKEGIAGECGYGCKARLVARANWRDNVELVEIAAWECSCGSAKLQPLR